MNATAWKASTSNTDAHRRAGGRRHYNSIRSEARALRRDALAQFIMDHGIHYHEYGVGRRLAHHFGLSESVISRDLKWLWEQGGRDRDTPQIHCRGCWCAKAA